jgi:acyl carrier protein
MSESTETVVIRILLEIVHEKGLKASHLEPDTALDASLGLDSLDFAEAVIRLEAATGKDPFAHGTHSVTTVRELASLYD